MLDGKFVLRWTASCEWKPFISLSSLSFPIFSKPCFVRQTSIESLFSVVFTCHPALGPHSLFVCKWCVRCGPIPTHADAQIWQLSSAVRIVRTSVSAITRIISKWPGSQNMKSCLLLCWPHTLHCLPVLRGLSGLTTMISRQLSISSSRTLLNCFNTYSKS